MTEPERPLFAGVKDEIGSLAADLKEMATLRWELARLELRAAVGLLRRLAVCLVLFGIMTLCALPILAVAVAELLDGRGIPGWGWLLIFGGGLLIGGAGGGYLTWRRFRRRFALLEQSLEELREDAVWLREWIGREQSDDVNA